MTKPHRHERAYREALAVFAARAPRALPADAAASQATLEAWCAELVDIDRKRVAKRSPGLDPAVVMAAVKRVTAVERWPTLPDLLGAIEAETRRLRELAVPANISKQLAANASPDPEWNAAGMEVTRLVLARKVRADDFEREHRAEYARRKAAGAPLTGVESGEQ